MEDCVESLQKMNEGPRHRNNDGCYTLLVYLSKSMETLTGFPTPTDTTLFCIQSTGQYQVG